MLNNILSSSGASGLLSKIKNNMSMGTMSIIVVVIILIGISIYYYYKSTGTKNGTSYFANHENINSGGGNGSNQAELLLFSVDWCPHCKTAKPEWDSLKQDYQGKTINGYTIIFTDVNCTNETPEVEKLMNTYKVEGYPTIKLLKDGQIIEYDAKPTKATLVQFLNSVL
jgi:thiol-disulfide isomerase/thioredoxin